MVLRQSVGPEFQQLALSTAAILLNVFPQKLALNLVNCNWVVVTRRRVTMVAVVAVTICFALAMAVAVTVESRE